MLHGVTNNYKAMKSVCAYPYSVLRVLYAAATRSCASSAQHHGPLVCAAAPKSRVGTRSCAVHGSLVVLPRAFHSSSSSDVGLFSISGLQKPEDFVALAHDTKHRGKQLIGRIMASSLDSSVVSNMDDLSNELCKTYDAAECCRCVVMPGPSLPAHSAQPTMRQRCNGVINSS